MATKVQPRPTGTAFTSAAEKRNWDKRYKETHNTDGTPKASSAKGRRGGIVDPVLPPKIDDTPKSSPAKGRRGGIVDPVLPPKIDTPKPAAKRSVSAGREVKNGKVFVSAEELKKSGLSLRDFLNKERGLTRREDKSKLKPLKSLEEDKKALAAKRAKDEARKKEVAAKVKAAGLAKGGMAKKKK